jgi:hypothetical protein
MRHRLYDISTRPPLSRSLSTTEKTIFKSNAIANVEFARTAA